ncbi:hypothetical protein FRB95_002487 [Tulasnella sp. JGI-2019a]|nr:hypothetical protein FRB95_002487 [Tulasnella sp. JGI-2019a]
MPFLPITLNDGRKIPSIAFGTGSVWKGSEMTSYVVQALSAGFVHIDSAQAYRTERSIGAALEELKVERNEVWLTTKYLNGGSVRDRLLDSLDKLGVKSVDLYLVHSPAYIINLVQTWKEFESVAREGLARSIGVSNCYAKDLELIMKNAEITPAVNQISFNPYKLREMLPILDYCRDHGIVVEAYSCLAPITRQPGGPVDEPVRLAAERIKATPAQVLLSWARRKGCVLVTTSSKRDRLDEYLAVANLPSLTEQEIQAIDDAGMKGYPTSIRQPFREPEETNLNGQARTQHGTGFEDKDLCDSCICS